MRICLPFILTLSFLAFAGDKYGVYDLQGNLVSTFEAERHELPEKTRQIKSGYPSKSMYVSLLKKGKTPAKQPASSYQYNFKTGSYIEAARKETFAICPPAKTEGTWISEHSVALSKENCLSVQAPGLAGTIDVLFMENSGRIDTIQVLVDQVYIQMGDYQHTIWTTELLKGYDDDIRGGKIIREMRRNGYYESRNYNQTLIVDKTKFTVADAWHYSKIDSSVSPFNRFDIEGYLKNVNLEESKLPLIISYEWRLANLRSKMEGLDPVYYANGVDTSASGYRVPFEEEWFFLMRAGASTRYYWGDEGDLSKKEDSLKISRHAWTDRGLKPVAQLLPNAFGLYDMVGIALERWIDYLYGPTPSINGFLSCLSPEYGFMARITGTSYGYESFRLVRKTPKLHKLEKF
jgi:hypothetical protein